MLAAAAGDVDDVLEDIVADGVDVEAAAAGALAVRETVLPEKLEEPPASVIVPDFKWHILFELL